MITLTHWLGTICAAKMYVILRVTLLLLAILATDTQDTCEHRPKITITSKQHLKLINKHRHFYEIRYGEDVTLYCSFKKSLNLAIDNLGNYLETETSNDTTIVLNVNKPNTGLQNYDCEDHITKCRDDIRLSVFPLQLAISPSIRESVDASHKRPLYFVPKGESYEVFCFADEASLLKIYYMEGYKIKKLLLELVNDTTAHSLVSADYPTERNYYCSNKLSATQPITVVIDYHPKAEDIQCILYESHKIDCTWINLSQKIHTFKLYYKQDADFILLCIDNYKQSNRGCTGIMPARLYYKSEYLNNIDSILLQSCNEIFCDNQTVLYNADAILKLDPTSDLKLLNTSRHTAVISWNLPTSVLSHACDFKLEYRLLATPWIQVNTSSVECVINRGTCEFQLPLPCSDSHYEIQVSKKLKTALEDRYWSEPIFLFFFTDPNSDEEDAMCSAESKELEPLPSVEVLLFKVRELIRFERKNNTALKIRIRALKKKLARIRELARLIDLDDKKSTS